MLCHCGAKLRVLEVREHENETVKRRTYECEGATLHKVLTYEFTSSIWNAAQYDIKKAIAGQLFHRRAAERAALVAKMKQDRHEGMSCPAISAKYGMSVDMVRYYTRLPRARLYPSVKQRSINVNSCSEQG